MKKLAILGCTGSIGRQTLEAIDWRPGEFEIVAVAARRDSPELRTLVAERRPRLVVIVDGRESGWQPSGVELRFGENALIEAATIPDLDVVMAATAGRAGLRPTLAALSAGINVALANKEVLVSAGPLVMRAAKEGGGTLLPVDSEHSAIWQSLLGESGMDTVRAITLTASGGALRDLPVESLHEVTPEQALRHPNWAMGSKITVDSATLMNKGLEVLEAACLFELALDQVRVVLHRESIVHALVEFVDGSVKAQLSVPDMRLPILYALSAPARLPAPVPSLNLAEVGQLTFSRVDDRRYPCLGLAYEAGRRGGTYPAVLNAANEVAVELFLSRAISFGDIHQLVRHALDSHVPVSSPNLDEVIEADEWARRVALDGGLVATASAETRRGPPRGW